MTKSHNVNENMHIGSFVGKNDPNLGITILWEIDEVPNKWLDFEEIPKIKQILDIQSSQGSSGKGMEIKYFIGYCGKFIFGLSIGRFMEQIRMALDCTAIENDIFTIYRMCLALCKLPEIKFPDDLVIVSQAVNPRNKFYSSGKNWLIQLIGRSEYENIMRGVPPDLEKASEMLLQMGAMINNSHFNREIKNGNIKSQELMKILKIRTPEEEKAREAAIERIAEPYWEYLSCNLGYKKCITDDRGLESNMKKCIYEVIARGITDKTDVIAMAILMYARDLYLEKSEPVEEMTETRVNNEMYSAYMSTMIEKLSEYFVINFRHKNMSLKELAAYFRNLFDNIVMMEPVDLV